MDERTCSRCGVTITRPHPEHGNYIISDDFAEAEKKEVTYAMVHTEKTATELDRLDQEIPDKTRQQIAAEAANPDAPDTIEVPDGVERVERESGSRVDTAVSKDVDFSIPVEEFDHVEIKDANRVQWDNRVAFTYTTTEQRTEQKTGLVCPDCVNEEDEIIWGESA